MSIAVHATLQKQWPVLMIENQLKHGKLLWISLIMDLCHPIPGQTSGHYFYW